MGRGRQTWRPSDPANENWRQTWDAIYQLRANHNAVASQVAAIPPVPTTQQIAQALQLGGVGSSSQNTQAVFSGTHAARLASFNPAAYGNTVFFETDRFALYYSNANSWILIGGRFNATQNNIAGLSLGASDNGMLVYVTDFAHLLQWNGTAFNYADADVPGRIEGFLVDPTGNGWVFCNGTNTTYLQANGTLSGNVTLPNFSAAAFAYLGWGNNANATFLATGPANATGNLLVLRPWFRR